MRVQQVAQFRSKRPGRRRDLLIDDFGVRTLFFERFREIIAPASDKKIVQLREESVDVAVIVAASNAS